MRSRFKLHAQSEELGITKNGTRHTTYGKAGFTQSAVGFTRFLRYRGTPKMVLSHIKYGKAGCDRDITPRLCMRDMHRDITTLSVSAHALIDHCLGYSRVTCQASQAQILFSGRSLLTVTVFACLALFGHDHLLPYRL